MMNLVKTIRAKLMFAMGALAVVAAGLAAFGIYGVNEFNNRINLVTGDISKRIIYVNRANEAFLAFYRFQKNHILETDANAKQKWEEQQAKAEADLNAALSEWDKVASEEGKRKLALVRSAFADFKREDDRILALSRSRQSDKARDLSNGESRRLAETISTAFADSQKLVEDAMQQQATETDVLYAQTRNWMVGITILAIGVCCFLAYFIVSHVVKGIALVVERIKDVAQGEGDLTKRIEVQNDDELGELSRWFNTFMEKFQQIIIQVAQSTEHIASAAEEISSTATQTSQSAITQLLVVAKWLEHAGSFEKRRRFCL